MASSVPKIEEIVLEKGAVGLGFNIRGGTDNIHVGEDPGIFVTTVKPNGAAAKDGRLVVGDKILEINNNDLREVLHHTAVNHFHEAGEIVTLLVERGAEQRIREATALSQLDRSSPEPPIIDPISDPSTKTIKYGHPSRLHPSSSRRRWGWLPLTLLGVGLGVSIFALIFFIRRKRS